MKYYSEFDKKILPPVLLLIIVVAITLALLLKDKSKRVRSIPTALIAIALLFIEVIKQRWNIRGEFNYYHLPLHYCSLFVILIPLGELCGSFGDRVFRPVATYLSFTVAVGMYLFPQSILGGACENFGVTFYGTHSFIFHHLVVLYFALVLFLDLYKPSVRDIAKVGTLGIIYILIAIPAAYIFDENYCNFLTSTLDELEAYRLENGQLAYTAVISVFLTLGTMISSFIYYMINKIFAFFKLCFGMKPFEDW